MIKIQPKTLTILFLLSTFYFLFSYALSVNAAVLYLEPTEGQYHQGDTFLVEARIDTEGECINTIEANLSFSKEILEAVDFSKGNSILTIWLKEPTFSVVELREADVSCGLVSFIGGIPGGYCGRIPGDPGKSNLLGKIIFKVKEFGRERFSAKLEFLDTSQVLLNDGFGTPAKLTTKEAVFTILPEKVEVPKEEWQEELKKDNIPPEPFEIEIHQDPSIFEGKYFIIFSTTDKQTGLDYFEVKEGKRDWKRVMSPYLLEDQNLKSIIKVKAADKAGNERIAEYLPKIPPKPFPYWIIILILIGIGIIWWIVRRKKIESRI